MSNNKKMVVLSWVAHMIIALVLCDQEQSIIKRILLLVSIGMISGIISICIKNSHPPNCQDSERAEPDSAS